MLLEDVLEEYLYYCRAKGFTKKTMINKRQELKQFKIYLKEERGIIDFEKITLLDLRTYARYKTEKGLQPQSVITMLKLIRAFYSWCVREEYIEKNIASKVELPRVPKKVLKGFTLKEVQSMVEAFSYKTYLEARNKAIVAMLADCGLRAMEIRGLKSINLKETTILVNGKGNKERVVFVSPALKRILIKYERKKKQYFEDKVTFDNYFLSYTGGEMSHVAIHNIIKEAGKRACIEGKRVSPHTFRHFYSVQSLNSGTLDLYSLSRLLGHSDISITQRYLQSMNDEQLLNKAISSSPLMNLK
ncbi:tyrosine-type recombinase/integrase [Bacillus sp. AFS017336]|uniref:tyrosine-type recombinase/integrase n=1 Tax=Bacillus sp. AFS017336 TaxID=2033489 RepID=UPI000BF12FB3|nr:tyrosine-type recombinase/integrase [Bacillus sp. AFS017336]PEL13770.1 recombinase [Bacillus sp. AFS017336]